MARSLTFLDVERNRDTTKNRINLWLSQWGTGLGLLVYALGLTLIAWQAWQSLLSVVWLAKVVRLT